MRIVIQLEFSEYFYDILTQCIKKCVVVNNINVLF